MPSPQSPDARPEAREANENAVTPEDDELETARKRVRDMKAAAESEGMVAKAKRLWGDFRAEADERNRQMLEDIERGKRKLAEKQKQLESKGGAAPQANRTPERLDSLPPLSASGAAGKDVGDGPSSADVMTRALAGFNMAFPFIGVVAGYSTIELMQQQSESSIYTLGSRLYQVAVMIVSFAFCFRCRDWLLRRHHDKGLL
jgi:hypothetical protein